MNNEFKRMQKLAGLITEAKAEIYPYEATPEKQALYDKIATVLEKFINNIASKLEIKPSDIRISCDGLWDEGSYKNRGLVVQIKANDNTWEKPWAGNALIMQTPNKEGVTIMPGDINMDGFKNKELRTIFDKASNLDLSSYVADFNTKLTRSLKPEEIELIAPNTPIVVTGKSSIKELNEDISFEAIDRMEGLANIQALDNLKSSLKTLVSDWVQDGGFDEDDVIDYLAFLVRNSY